jgi:hypothetical protein
MPEPNRLRELGNAMAAKIPGTPEAEAWETYWRKWEEWIEKSKVYCKHCGKHIDPGDYDEARSAVKAQSAKKGPFIFCRTTCAIEWQRQEEAREEAARKIPEFTSLEKRENPDGEDGVMFVVENDRDRMHGIDFDDLWPTVMIDGQIRNLIYYPHFLEKNKKKQYCKGSPMGLIVADDKES